MSRAFGIGFAAVLAIIAVLIWFGFRTTQGNHLAMIENTAALGIVRKGEVDFFFLPLAHSFARMIAYYGLYVGSTTAFARSIGKTKSLANSSRRSTI